MAGRGNTSCLPEELQKPQQDVLFHYLCGFAADNAGPFRSNGWVSLQPGEKHNSTKGRHFGPEITFGKTLAERKSSKSYGIIKVAVGGTNLAEDWNPDVTTGMQLYRQLIERIALAVEQLSKLGHEENIRSMLWMQGEADTLVKEHARDYRKNQKYFINRVRRDLEKPNLPFIMGQIMNRNNHNMIFADVVRKAQKDVASEVPYVELISTDDLTDTGDGIHFDATALMDLGKRYANAYLRL